MKSSRGLLYNSLELFEEILENRELEQVLEKGELLDEELEVDKEILFKCESTKKNKNRIRLG